MKKLVSLKRLFSFLYSPSNQSRERRAFKHHLKLDTFLSEQLLFAIANLRGKNFDTHFVQKGKASRVAISLATHQYNYLIDYSPVEEWLASLAFAPFIIVEVQIVPIPMSWINLYKQGR